MNLPEIPSTSTGTGAGGLYGGGNPSPLSKRKVHLQGPRPTPLRVNKDSHKIKKPPPPKPPFHPPPHPPPSYPAGSQQPVIIYSVSPRIIHADASNFMSVVQRLTGNTSFDETPSTAAAEPISPAARLAVINRTSPRERDRERETNLTSQDELVGIVEGVDLGQIPGILSPAPANLPEIRPGMFSPAAGEQSLLGFNELMSPWTYGNGGFLPSPSALSYASPCFSPGEFCNIFNH